VSPLGNGRKPKPQNQVLSAQQTAQGDVKFRASLVSAELSVLTVAVLLEQLGYYVLHRDDLATMGVRIDAEAYRGGLDLRGKRKGK
jgi:hypothetical protein